MSMPETSNPSDQEAGRWLSARRVRRVVGVTVVLTALWVLCTAERGASWQGLMAVDWKVQWVAMALGLVLLRDLGYMWRLRVLSMGTLTWPKTASSIVLWEFASAMTPSVVGGSAVASFILHRNGMRWGQSLATVMSTALLDELFFVLAVPAVALWVGWSGFLPETQGWWTGSVALIFGGGYLFMACLALFLSAALFWMPRTVRSGLMWLFSLGAMRRWSVQGRQFAEDLLLASRELQSMSWRRWGQAAAATCISWMARFGTLHALLMAFLSAELAWNWTAHWHIWARQLSLWTVMMISPTPGSSGLAEFALPAFLEGVLPLGMTLAMWTALVLLWRMLTSHLYLLVGAGVLPFWLRRTERR